MGLLDPLCSDNCSLRCCGGASSNIKEGLFQALLPGVGSWIQLGLSPQFQGLVGWVMPWIPGWIPASAEPDRDAAVRDPGRMLW